MSGKKIGYIRVSSFEQNPERQLEGITLNKKFIDKASGKNTARPQLEAMLDYARDGDTIIIHSMDRLARNLDDLRKLVTQFTGQQIRVEFVKWDFLVNLMQILKNMDMIIRNLSMNMTKNLVW